PALATPPFPSGASRSAGTILTGGLKGIVQPPAARADSELNKKSALSFLRDLAGAHPRQAIGMLDSAQKTSLNERVFKDDVEVVPFGELKIRIQVLDLFDQISKIDDKTPEPEAARLLNLVNNKQLGLYKRERTALIKEWGEAVRGNGLSKIRNSKEGRKRLDIFLDRVDLRRAEKRATLEILGSAVGPD
ncbi:MAG: hypothetical protein RLP02_10025, partial [Coleofasciculus sp. C2-GNP5-27]